MRSSEFVLSTCMDSIAYPGAGRDYSAYIPDHEDCHVTARTLQGMARARSGQAPAWPLVSDRSARRGSRVKHDFACTLTRNFPSVLVVLRSQSCLRLEGRARILSGPSPGLSPVRAVASSSFTSWSRWSSPCQESGSARETGSGVSPGGFAKGGALCTCGVITQGAQLPGTGVRGGSPGEKGPVRGVKSEPYGTLPMVLGRAVCQPEKRKVGGSTPPLTTSSRVVYGALTCADV